MPIAPDLVATDANGFYSVNYAGFTPYIVSAIKELSAKIGTEFSNAETATSTSANATSTLPAWAGAFADASDSLKSALAQFSDAAVQVFGRAIYATAGIFEKLLTKELTFTRATGDEIDVQKLCIGATCITEDQLKAMLAAAGTEGVSAGDNSSTSTSSTSAAPTISVNGSNPATIAVGATYADLGATITGPTEADKNLGIHAFVNGIAMDVVLIDASTAGTHTIDYVATNAFGIATSTRTVIVEAPADTAGEDTSQEGEDTSDTDTATTTSTSDTTTPDEADTPASDTSSEPPTDTPPVDTPATQ